MVGVAGRSRGCKTCRRARVKCDETRPACNRCVRLKRICESFPPYPVFVDCFTHREIQSGHESSDDNKPKPTICRSPSVDPGNVFLTHLMNSLFTNPQTAGNSKYLLPCLVLATMQPEKENSSTHLAVGALAAVYYGKRHMNQKAISRGSMLYTRALSETRTDLHDPVRVLETTTLTNLVFLVLYEIVTFKDTTGWLTHLVGIGEIIRLRGPHRHQTGIDRELFKMTRNSIVLGHLISGKHCFLEEYAWKVVPWANEPDSKTAIDYLVDIMCDVPRILEDIKLLDESPTTFDNLQTLWSSIALRIKSCIESLYLWRAKWATEYSNTAYGVELNVLRDLKAAHLDTYPFSNALFFDEPLRATEIGLYNSFLVILYRAWRRVPTSVIMTPPVPGTLDKKFHNPVLLSPGQGSMQDIINEICKLTYYQLIGYPGNTGAMQMMFPLQLAHRNVDSKSKEANWILQMIGYIANVHGFEAVKYAQGVQEVTIMV